MFSRQTTGSCETPQVNMDQNLSLLSLCHEELRRFSGKRRSNQIYICKGMLGPQPWLQNERPLRTFLELSK
ncbi:hypothetical protein CHARACLAT_015306 [Characodon lateralis]|uniref:Uncharacterized protein n=1 Tax=Characodon lateralis TaxID=208331 RepID=A0ABU7E2T9_9TELE|nr:hypothetical protein [Characodon lateralis]